MTDCHRPPHGQPRHAARRTLLVAVVLAMPVFGVPASPQESAAGPFAEMSRFMELKSELMARLEADDPDAVALAEQVLELTVRLFGHQHPEDVNAVVHLAYAQQLAGRYQEARLHYDRALGLAEKLIGPDEPLTGIVLKHSGHLLMTLGELEDARAQLERSLSIMERHFDPDSLDIAIALGALGNLLHTSGDLAGARRRLTRTVEILEKQKGPDDPDTASALGNLAMVLLADGELKSAHDLMERANRIDLLRFGKGHLKIAKNYNNLARIVSDMGNPVAARHFLETALAIYEKELPPDHPDIAITLANLGSVLNDLRLYDEAKDLLTRAEAIQRKALGDEHPYLTCTLSSLQSAHEGRDAALSIPFDWNAIRRSMKPDARSSHVALNNAACKDVHEGNPEAAIVKLGRVIADLELSLGLDHQELVKPLINLATTLARMGRSTEALTPTIRALDIEERVLSRMMARGALEEAEAFLDKLVGSTFWALSLQLRLSENEEAVALGLTTVLRRKGRDLEARGRPEGSLDDPETEELMRSLREAREEWTFLHLQGGSIGGADSDTLCRLTHRVRLLGSELRKVHDRLGNLSVRDITPEAVQRFLPKGAALIEFFIFDPFEGVVKLEEDAPRYLSYVLHAEGGPSWVDLGEVTDIDSAVADFRDSLDGGAADFEKHAHHLYELTMARIKPLLRDVTTLLVSPDGALNLVPFGALVDDKKAFLIEHYTLSYLSSGRDLLRVDAAPSREAPLVLGDPALRTGPTITVLNSLDLASLPGTQKEARAVAAALKLAPSRLLLGGEAQESAVKNARAPKILHLATHGFFVGDPTPDREGLPACLESSASLDPLLRSGLLLSGASPASASDDGILTAAEVMDLDLAGTEIVTLSACETGVGEVRPGRGVYGLRRALVLAGAKSQVMSLWPVDDQATAAMMDSFYAQLAAGEARDEALRRVQLAGLEGEPLPVTRTRIRRGVSPRTGVPIAATHPYFWSGFILAGATGPLDWSPRAPRRAANPKAGKEKARQLLSECVQASDPILIQARAKAARRLFAEAGDSLGEGLSVAMIGGVEVHQGHYEAGQASFDLALEIVTPSQDVLGTTVVRMGEAATWRSVQLYGKATALLQEVLEELEAIKNEDVSFSLESTRYLLPSMFPTELLEQVGPLLDLLKPIFIQVLQSMVFVEMDGIEQEQGHYDEALQTLDRALALPAALQIGAHGILADKADIELALGRPARALELFESALPLARQRGDLAQQARILRGAADAHEREGRNEEAAEYRARADALVPSGSFRP